MSGQQIHLEVKDAKPVRRSAFTEDGMFQVIDELKEEIRNLYGEGIPLVVGWSGGKDSTACLQLVWSAVSELPKAKRTNRVHVITTDTMVENPVVAAYVEGQLGHMNQAATDQDMPIEAHRLTPDVEDRFFVNLIGRGFAAPRPKFRWCTERLKIKPSNRFIRDVISQAGEAILVLGTRKAESAARAKSMERHEKGRVRDRLSPNGSLPGSLVYSPIEAFTDDDVWTFLMQHSNTPWGTRNHDLLTLYQGATEDGECPLVVDSSTPSCGDSRFGCWTCTMVEQDKSMGAMIANDQHKDWMIPLLAIRDELDVRDETGNRNDYHLRDFRRSNGNLQLFHNEEPAPGKTQRETLVPGPYLQEHREYLLRRVLEAQQTVRKIGPPEVAAIELLTIEDLEAIRAHWLTRFHEFEDRLPVIYEQVTGNRYPAETVKDDGAALGPEYVEILREICGDDTEQFRMIREMLSIEQQDRSKLRRHGILDKLEKTVRKGGFENEQEALENALHRRRELATGRPAEGEQQVLDSTLA